MVMLKIGAGLALIGGFNDFVDLPDHVDLAVQRAAQVSEWVVREATVLRRSHLTEAPEPIPWPAKDLLYQHWLTTDEGARSAPPS